MKLGTHDLFANTQKTRQGCFSYFTVCPVSIKLSCFVAAGLIVETVGSGVNGCVVRSVTENEAVAKDGRIHVGDFVVRINDESLRRVTNAQARAILRRSSMLSSNVTYVCRLNVFLCVFAQSASLLHS